MFLKITEPESTMECQDDQLCAEIKAGIDITFHGVQDIWYEKSTTEDWGFLLVDTKTSSTR